MKKFLLLAICFMAVIFGGCEYNAPATSNKVVTGSVKDVTTNSAVLYGKVNVDISEYDNVKFGIMISDNKEELNNRDGWTDIVNVMEGNEFFVEVYGLSPETEYYYCAWLLLNYVQYEYGSIKKFTTEKEDAVIIRDSLSFSVSSSKQVRFAKGNLQYHPTNDEWRFAEKQTDYIGIANSNISSTYNGWLDLFAWSTGATNFGVSSSKDNNDYSGSFVDWGTNIIGTDEPNTWRTLTYDEWNYLMFNRHNADSLKGVACINGVNGLILLPDYWVRSEGVNFEFGFHTNSGAKYYADNQSLTVEQWAILEQSGAIFLPAAGGRYGVVVDHVQDYGLYWSATENNSNNAHFLFFYSDGAHIPGHNRYYGNSVRLVKDL